MPGSPPRHLGLTPRPTPIDPGLAAYERVGSDPGVVVCVHGSLDRGGSFARIARRLDGPSVIAYDRRGYQGSRALGPARRFDDHVEDLLSVIADGARNGDVTVVGHSFGGVVALGAAIRAPRAMRSLVVYEPPMPWLSSESERRTHPPLTEDPALEVERFFRRMVSDHAWEHLGEAEREDRIADGIGLLSDLRIIRTSTPFSLDELVALEVSLTIGVGTSSTTSQHLQRARAVAEVVPDGSVVVLEGAGHGAHLSAPDAMASMIKGARQHPGRM